MGVAGGCLYTPTIAYTFAAFPRRAPGPGDGLRGDGGRGRAGRSRSWDFPALFAAIGLTPAFLRAPGGGPAAWGLGRGPRAPGHARRAASRPRARIRDLARERDFWLLAVGFAFVGMLAQVAVLSWMPTYLRQIHGFGVVGAGVSTGIVRERV